MSGPYSIPERVPFDLSFLADFSYSSAIVSFRPLRAGLLPLFYGTSMRGALGYRIPLMHPLHEAVYGGDAKGGQPRPFILAPQSPSSWEAIVSGGPVTPPFSVEPSTDGRKLPELSVPSFHVEPDGVLRARLTLLGRYAAYLGDLLRFLAAGPLRVDDITLELVEARDAFEAGPALWTNGAATGDRPQVHRFAPLLTMARRPVRRLRMVLVSPMTLHVEGAGERLTPAQFLKAALVRAIGLFDAFEKPPGQRTPQMELPLDLPKIAGSRLYRCYFQRVSHLQQRSMSFGGLIGHVDLAGDSATWLPLLAAAELLHVGQKASVGLGQVRCLLAP
jgi:hypothetical protein